MIRKKGVRDKFVAEAKAMMDQGKVVLALDVRVIVTPSCIFH